jgi:pyruvate dehydrogenase E2 component (dihydrolipoamide acetyltransferase)
MSKQVVMPQMGESVAEGTIVRWLKKVGDQVERDEPLFEISTDKVDAEIPSPSAGVLRAINVQEGATVPINTVVAVIEEAGGAAQAAPAAQPAKPKAAAAEPAPAPKPAPAPVRTPVSRTPARALSTAAPSTLARPWSAAEARQLRLSPVVRKIAREHHVDVRNIAGSGDGGRVTKSDILAYIEAGSPVTPAGREPGTQQGALELLPRLPASLLPSDPSTFERTPMTVMRRKIAEHMVMSKRTSAHVHSAFEIDFTAVEAIRQKRKAEYEKAGGKLTYMSFITKACAEALKAVPVVNASVDGADILYKKDINVGIAVALEWGLIVPVVKGADRMNLLEISKAISDLAARARDKKLKPDEVQGGTFTITNPGVFGALFGMPIISQPQVAILGVGAVEKRPVVLDDAVTVRLRAYMTIGYDHRVIDGAVADQFMQHVKKKIENWTE